MSKNEHNPAVPTAFGPRGHIGDKEAKDGCVHSELPRNTGTLATESCVWTVAHAPLLDSNQRPCAFDRYFHCLDTPTAQPGGRGSMWGRL